MPLGITNITAVGFIYRESDPSEIFIEVKDDGYPIKLARRQLCPIGGNWIGEGAKADKNTLDTFRRELMEELSFDRPVRNSMELAELGMADAEVFAPMSAVTPTEVARQELRYLKRFMTEMAIPFGDYLNSVSKEALDSADPGNTRDGFVTLASYFLIGLPKNAWTDLVRLQSQFGNLSNESLTLVTSLSEIVRTGAKTAFGHDRVLKEFFLRHGLSEAEEMSLVPGITSSKVGDPLQTYEQYLRKYDVAKKP